MQDSVERIGRIASEQITTRVLPVPMENNFLSSLEKTSKFGNNL